MERASGWASDGASSAGGRDGDGEGGRTLAVRGRDWQHLAEYDFGDGGQPSRYIDILIYQLPRLPTDRAIHHLHGNQLDRDCDPNVLVSKLGG